MSEGRESGRRQDPESPSTPEGSESPSGLAWCWEWGLGGKEKHCVCL